MVANLLVAIDFSNFQDKQNNVDSCKFGFMVIMFLFSIVQKRKQKRLKRKRLCNWQKKKGERNMQVIDSVTVTVMLLRINN
jgi:hypothetical protein